MTVLLTMGSMLMDQQCILNKMSLNRNTHETNLCTNWLIQSLVFPLGATVQASVRGVGGNP